MGKTPLHERTSIDCKKVDALSVEVIAELSQQLDDWYVQGSKLIRKQFVFNNFVEAVSFINHIADIAEENHHHPDLHLTGYKILTVEWTTHAVGGLSENDFILAAKVDQLLEG